MSKILCTINHLVPQKIPDESKTQGNFCSHRAAEKAGHDDYQQGLTDMVFKDGGLPLLLENQCSIYDKKPAALAEESAFMCFL